MLQMYKVFINDKVVFLTPSCDLELLANHMVYLRYDDFEELHFLISMLEETELMGAVIYGANFDILWADFRAHFREIEAAGGVVRNQRGEILFIHRLEKWDLPKGKIEPGEEPLEAALREVEEECGILDLKAGAHLADTYHTYTVDGIPYLKRTYWYEMYSEQNSFTAQKEEGITLVKWLGKKEVDWQKMQSYESIKDMLNQSVLH
jgi:8-oxo-dGTP pyrophosphatase MutT (NUDIX family)